MKACLLLFGYVIFGCASPQADADKAIGACGMEAVRLDLSSGRRDDFVEACMMSKGYRFKYGGACYAKGGPTAACYTANN